MYLHPGCGINATLTYSTIVGRLRMHSGFSQSWALKQPETMKGSRWTMRRRWSARTPGNGMVIISTPIFQSWSSRISDGGILKPNNYRQTASMRFGSGGLGSRSKDYLSQYSIRTIGLRMPDFTRYATCCAATCACVTPMKSLTS